MRLRLLAGRRHHLEPRQREAFGLEPLDDLADELPPYAVGLDHEKCLFHRNCLL